jgi:hypothetical protein
MKMAWRSGGRFADVRRKFIHELTVGFRNAVGEAMFRDGGVVVHARATREIAASVSRVGSVDFSVPPNSFQFGKYASDMLAGVLLGGIHRVFFEGEDGLSDRVEFDGFQTLLHR